MSTSSAIFSKNKLVRKRNEGVKEKRKKKRKKKETKRRYNDVYSKIVIRKIGNG